MAKKNGKEEGNKEEGNKEEGRQKGRKEEGRQKALTSASCRKKGANAPPFFVRRSANERRDPVPDEHASNHVALLQLINHFQARNDSGERRISGG